MELNNVENSEYITIDEIAKDAGVTRDTIIKWLKHDRIKHCRMSRRVIRIRLVDYEDFKKKKMRG